MPRRVLLSLRQFEGNSLCCHSSTSSSILLHPSLQSFLPVALSSYTHPCSSTILLCPSLSAVIPKAGGITSIVAVERKLSSLGLEQVEENLQGPALKAALLDSTHLPAVACPVHLLHAWFDMPSVRAGLRAEMWACILKWWFPSDLLPSHVMQSLQSRCSRLLTVQRSARGWARLVLYCSWNTSGTMAKRRPVCLQELKVLEASIHLLHKWNFWKNNWAGKSLFQSEACCFLSYFKTLSLKQRFWFSKCTWEPLPMSSQPLCSAETFHSTAFPCARHHLWHNTLLTRQTLKQEYFWIETALSKHEQCMEVDHSNRIERWCKTFPFPPY